MSGKAKGAPRTPEEEREQLRQLTRELHEAAQNARDAAKELRETADNVVRPVDEITHELIKFQEARLRDHFNKQFDLTQEAIVDGNRAINEHFSSLMKLGARDLVIQTCGMILHLANPQVTVRDWVETLAGNAEDHKASGCDPCPGSEIFLGPQGAAEAEEAGLRPPG